MNFLGEIIVEPYDWLTVWCLMPFSTVFQLYRGRQCTHPCFPQVILTSTPLNSLSKPLAAFSHNHCWNNRQRWERNESCRNDYHKSSERILAKAGDRNQPPSVLKSPTLPTQLWGSARAIWSRWPKTIMHNFSTWITHSHTTTPFDTPGKPAFWKHCGKRRNCS